MCVCVCVCVLQFSCVVVLRVVVVCEEFKLFHTLPLLGWSVGIVCCWVVIEYEQYSLYMILYIGS